MAADDHVDAVENAGLEHIRLGYGRHHFLAGRAEDDDAAGRMRAVQVLGHGDGGGHSDRALRVVLVAVERALRAAQRVVFEDHTHGGRTVVVPVARHEGRGQIGNAHRNFKAVFAQVVRQLAHRAFLFESDFRMLADVVAQGGEFGVHQLFGAGNHFVALGIGCGQFRDPAGHVERLLKRIHFLQNVAGRFAFGGSFLGRAERCKGCQ